MKINGIKINDPSCLDKCGISQHIQVQSKLSDNAQSQCQYAAVCARDEDIRDFCEGDEEACPVLHSTSSDVGSEFD